MVTDMKMGFTKKYLEVFHRQQGEKEIALHYIGCLSIACPFPVLCCIGNNISGWDSDHHRIYTRRLHHARL